MEAGDIAVHGHEVYPSDIPSLGFPSGYPPPVSRGSDQRRRAARPSSARSSGDRRG